MEVVLIRNSVRATTRPFGLKRTVSNGVDMGIEMEALYKYMKTSTGIILLSFLALNILGFSSLAHADHMSHHSCVFNLVNSCVTLVDPMNSASEHLSSLQSSIQASLSQSNISSLLLLALLLVVVGLISTRIRPEVLNYLQKHRLQFFQNLFEFKTSFLAWLSILNKRDPLAIQMAR